MSETKKNIIIWALIILILILTVTIGYLGISIINIKNTQIEQSENQNNVTDAGNKTANILEPEINHSENEIIKNEDNNINIRQLTPLELEKIQDDLTGNEFLINTFDKPENANIGRALGCYPEWLGIINTYVLDENERTKVYADYIAYIVEKDYPEILDNASLSEEEKHEKIISSVEKKLAEDEEYWSYASFDLKIPYSVIKDYITKNLAISANKIDVILEGLKSYYLDRNQCYYINTQGTAYGLGFNDDGTINNSFKIINGTIDGNGLYSVEYVLDEKNISMGSMQEL